MLKKILSFLMAAILISAISVQGLAATTTYLQRGSRAASGQCCVARTGKSPAYVQCIGQQGCKIMLVIRTDTNVLIWEGLIGSSGQRTVTLGTGYTKYKISGKYISGNANQAELAFYPAGNCTLK